MGSGSEFQIVGAADENDLQPYFLNFADGIVRSILYLIRLYQIQDTLQLCKCQTQLKIHAYI